MWSADDCFLDVSTKKKRSFVDEMWDIWVTKTGSLKHTKMKILSYYNDRLIDHKTFDEILLSIK